MDEKKYCPYCEEELTREDKFCPHCGRSLAEFNSQSFKVSNIANQSKPYMPGRILGFIGMIISTIGVCIFPLVLSIAGAVICLVGLILSLVTHKNYKDKPSIYIPIVGIGLSIFVFILMLLLNTFFG